MNKVLLLALAGAGGTLSRYWLAGAVYALLGREFPWGTAVVNVLGCLLFGLVWALADERLVIRPELRLIILVGFMGAFTTFSSLVYETSELMRGSDWLRAFLNYAGQTALGFAALWLGAAIGRII